MIDVQVHGAGWIGLAIAQGLRAAGVNVQIVDPRGAFGGASGRSVGVALPMHPEHPHRFEAALGNAVAGEISAFLRRSVALLPGLDRTGIRVRGTGPETEEMADSRAAAERLGWAVSDAPGGYQIREGGLVDLSALAQVLAPGSIPVVAAPGAAEIQILATGWAVDDPWLADKLMPIRLQAVRFSGPALACPVVSQHMSVRWSGGLIASGARWATSHMEVGETECVPSTTVTAMLARLTGKPVSDIVDSWAGIVGESCDGLPIIGPIPGRPRTVVCVGFGAAGLSYGMAAAAAVVDGVLGRTSVPVPVPLSSARFA